MPRVIMDVVEVSDLKLFSEGIFDFSILKRNQSSEHTDRLAIA